MKLLKINLVSLPWSKSKEYMGLIDKKRSLEKFLKSGLITDHLIY